MSEIEMSREDLELLDLCELDRHIETLLDAVQLARTVRLARLGAYERAIRRSFAWYEDLPLDLGHEW